MIDYTQPPLAYLVRIPQADQDSLLHGEAIRLAEDAGRFLGYEQIGPVVSSGAAAAVETAERIFAAVHSTYAGVEFDDHLEETIASYLRNREAGAPAVLVCDLAALRAGLAAANVCGGVDSVDGVDGMDGTGDLIAPGGIVSIHRDPGAQVSRTDLVAIARHMILNFEFADLVAMAADHRVPNASP